MLAIPMADPLSIARREPLPGDASDEALIDAHLAGDPVAFGRLVRRYDALVYRIVRRYAQTPEDARDLAQRAFLKALEASRRVLPKLVRFKSEPFKAWLLRIAVNLAKNHARDRRRWKLAPIEALDGAAVESADPLHAAERAEARARTRKAVLELPKRQREVFTLRIDGELPFAEIAQALGITENNAKVSFHLAVKRLRAELGEER